MPYLGELRNIFSLLAQQISTSNTGQEFVLATKEWRTANPHVTKGAEAKSQR